MRRLYPPFPAESLPDVGLLALAFITPLGHGTQHGTRGTGGAPRGLQADPTPDPSTLYPGMEMGWFFFLPHFPQIWSKPQYCPSCDSRMGERSSCVPGVKHLG